MRVRRVRLRAAAVLLAGLAALIPAVASAHDGALAESGDLWQALTVWRFDAPGVVLTLALALAYVWGYRRLRANLPAEAVFRFSRWRPAAFATGIALMLLSLVSPIDTYSDDLFWVHMIQHVLILMLIAPLLLLGAPATLALRAASPRVRQTYIVPLLNSRLLQFFLYPPIAVLVLVGAIWIWHIPTLYDAAIDSELLHFIEHSTFLAGGLLFWWLIIGVDASHLRPGHIARIAILIVAILQNLALGLLLTSVGEAAYDSYAMLETLRDWGPSALADQRIGAGIMWVPGTMMFALAVLVIVYYWAEHESFRSRRDDLLRDLDERAGRPVYPQISDRPPHR
ncbi:MAG: putative copper resistance protein D [Chloroflexi bacterium]|nr:MAG: putative copper resistance protein D [Chloroflexota bacterium]